MHFMLLAPNVNIDFPDAQGVHVVEIAKAISEAGHGISVTAQALSTDQLKSFPQDIRFIRVPGRKGFLGTFWRELQVLRNIFIYWRNFKPDVLYIRQYMLGFLPAFLAKILRIAVIIEVNGMYLDDRRLSKAYPSCILRSPFLLHLVEKYISSVLILGFHLAAGVVVVAPGLIRYLHDRHGIRPEKIHCCPNGVNVNRIALLSRETYRSQVGLSVERNYIGFFGSLSPWQGIECLLRAFSLVSQKIPNLNLLIVGSGEMDLDLKELVAELELKKRVVFTGGVSHEQALAFTGAVDFTVAPYTISWPRNRIMAASAIKIPESLAAGRPVIASNLPGLEYIETECVGFLAEPDNVEDLAGQLIRAFGLSEGEYKNMTKRARKLAEQKLSWTQTVRCITSFFRKQGIVNHNRI